MPVSGFINWGIASATTSNTKHEVWSEVIGFSHGMSQPAQATRSNDGGGNRSEVIHDPFSITIRQDAASPKLYQALSGRKPVGVAIVFAGTGSDAAVSGRIDVPKAIITQIKPSPHTKVTPGGAVVKQCLTVTFTSYNEYYYNGFRNPVVPNVIFNQWEYTKQDNTGVAKGTVATKVNLAKAAGAS
jgi:type VI secretion system Hcp family effector